MIPHSSGQPWGPSLRTVNGHGRGDNAMGYEHLDRAMQQPVRPTVDLTAGGPESQDREPPPKRPRLEVPGGATATNTGGTVNPEARSTPASATSRPTVSWRGRPLWSFQAVVSEIPNSENRGDGAGSKPLSPPPLPAQPWRTPAIEPPATNVVKSRESSPVGAVQTTPYCIETPSAAPLYHNEKPADFTPWTGDHPEDILNEQTAKQGYYDRTQVSQNESNTARPALYAQLKHRTGLQMLSSVFAAALEKRQKYNTSSKESRYKPPPRVTLTDGKREVWLRELANPTVPLRRLSRSVPYGIRGRLLLDHCIAKWIPVARAVWLAKCVGVNEIRAIKRKGMTGALAVGLEAKWVREWTTNVQQFVEGIFNAPKSSDWKAKMTYAVGFTARLFFENLLDHDHFLEWFLTSFETASLSKIPVWLLMLGVYWKSILRYRRRGRRLAELLLEKLRQATEAKLAPLQPLIDRLGHFIQRLVRDHTSSMILPNTWETYKHLVASVLDLDNTCQKALFQNLAERNARVQRPNNSKQTNNRSPHQHIIRLFDSIHSAHDISSISSNFDTFEDKAVLVSKLLEWLSTPFRHGLCRVYVGARLLRRWKLNGVDIDSHILSFLSRRENNQKLNMDQIYHVISELVRSQTFSVGRYLQWLMAKGVINSPSTEDHDMKDLPIDIGLIAQLPVGRLPEHVANLRNTLLTRTGLSVSAEPAVIDNVKDIISQRLPGIFGDIAHTTMSLDSLPPSLTWAVKAEIGQWLRRAIAQHNRKIPESTTGAFAVGILPMVSALTPSEFYTVRDILESFGDISMLADVLNFASSCTDGTVLASVADTTNCHFDSLCVIGATTDLFRRLIDAYAGIKKFGMPSLDLIFSLIELGLRIPSELNTVAILRQDLSRMENKSIVTAYSPVSDHIPVNLGGTDPLLREKLDQILLTGSVMDEPTLDTIFSALTKHLESEEGHSNLSANDTCRYLAQLRSFHPKHFDVILARWVCGHLRSPDRTTLLRILPPLIGVGCVTIRAFLALAKRLTLSTPTTIPNTARLPADLLQLLLPSPEESRLFDLVSYRFQLAQQEFLNKHTEEALKIVCDVAASADTVDAAAKYHDLEQSMVMLLRDLLVRKPECVSQKCMQKLAEQYPAALTIVQKSLGLLLSLDSNSDQKSGFAEIEKLASMTDDFSLPFCQLKLQVLFHADSGTEDRNSIVDAMFKTAVADCRARRVHWVDLVALMSPDAVRQIRERAEKHFFSVPLLEDLDDDTSDQPNTPGPLETAKLYLTIIEELAGSVPESGTSSIGSVLVEKMDALLHKIITTHSTLSNAQGKANQIRTKFERGLAFWFSALLRMVVIHRSAFIHQPQTLKPNPPHNQLRLLISIFCIALSRLPGNVLRLFPAADYFPHPTPLPEEYRPCPGILLQTHALDVAASLIDIFPDEVRFRCARFLKEKCPSFVPFQNDSRFLYLLGPTPDQTSANSQQVSAPSPAASTSTPTSTPAPLPAVAASVAQQSTLSASSAYAEDTNCIASRLRLQYRGTVVGSCPVIPWEVLEDAAPFVNPNDTAIHLAYFDARRVRA
ncbi:uncharacterized protein N7511_004135 [Penicillium nucicola]|uniref:uncharacterized protein n=1 Tax=Penicillium nucicola TaxID=1850975 RepID=UPI002544D4D9|nr:uncharacterized protein N7511_004135 [Penicillium nucicola]KAJ5766519.1 hypothetical protein N7511_004135 [Penicillium nucicola]